MARKAAIIEDFYEPKLGSATRSSVGMVRQPSRRQGLARKIVPETTTEFFDIRIRDKGKIKK